MTSTALTATPPTSVRLAETRMLLPLVIEYSISAGLHFDRKQKIGTQFSSMIS